MILTEQDHTQVAAPSSNALRSYRSRFCFVWAQMEAWLRVWCQEGQSQDYYLPERACWLIHESLMVRTYICVLDRGKNADFIESVFFFFVWEFAHFDFFEGVSLSITESEDRVDAAVGTLTCIQITQKTSKTVFNATLDYLSPSICAKMS